MLLLPNIARATALALCVLSGTTAAKKPDHPLMPMQLRLAYAGPNGMMVSWNTYHKLAKPTVHYGTSPRQLTHTASSTESTTYKTSTTYNNHVKVRGLKPNTQYYYRVIHGDKVQTFKTSRSAGDHTPYTMATVVDLGTMGDLGLSDHTPAGDDPTQLNKSETNTIQSLKAHIDQYDFLLHPGDIAYADYWLKEEIQGYLPNTTIENGYKVYEAILNKFYDELAPITRTKPYMVGPGNHEANCDNGGTTNSATNTTYTVSICMPGQRNFTGYRNHFRMPSEESGGTGNFWYSFDHGMTHFVVFDTETDFGHGLIAPDEPGGSEGEDAGPFNSTKDAQTKFLHADLSAVDRKQTPWIVVAGHRPWYVNAGSGDICTECQDIFEPIFIEHKVDLVMSGHFHVYQRNAPTKENIPDPRGLNNPSAPWYITNGAAGHYDGLDEFVDPPMAYSRFTQNSTYGWSRLNFHNCSHLTHEFVDSGSGKVLDTATLYKKRSC